MVLNWWSEGEMTVEVCVGRLQLLSYLYGSGSQPFFLPGRTMVQVQVSRAARMSFTYYVINTNQPDL